MSKEKYNGNGRRFKHLTKEKRAQIEVLLEQQVPKTEIAKTIGISRSTLYREIDRGTVVQIDTNLKTYQKYCWDAGERVYQENRRNSRPPLKLTDAYDFIQYAEQQILENKLSPDAVCGRARISGEFSEIVCTKTLYNYIAERLLKVRNIDLPLKVRRKQKYKPIRKNRRVYGISIEERPDLSERETFGHWEIDTVLGDKESAPVLLTLIERMTRKCHIVLVGSKSKESVKEGLEQIKAQYGSRASEIFKSITSDNGCEFAELTKQMPGTKIYYAHPYSSWERGTNEKQNSLIRRFFPKGKSFRNVSAEAVAFVENWLNDLPRKILGYHSSNEVFENVPFDIAI